MTAPAPPPALPCAGEPVIRRRQALRARVFWAAPLLLVVALPLAGALALGAAPAFERAAWDALLADPRLPRALGLTILVAVLSTGLSLVLAFTIVAAFHGRPGWRRLERLLAPALAVPHLAFAVGLAFLLAPAGWIARLVALLAGWEAPPTGWAVPHDPAGLTLAAALVVKETPFLIWALAAALPGADLDRLRGAAAALGASRARFWIAVALPVLLPRIALPIAAVLAYSTTVVDVALILGPSLPPPLAVLVWEAMQRPGGDGRAGAGSLVLALSFLAMAASARGLWRLARPRLSGAAEPLARAATAGGRLGTGLLVAAFLGAGAMLAAWSLAARWPFPDLLPQGIGIGAWAAALPGLADPLVTTLLLGVASTMIATGLVIAWLEAHPTPPRGEGLLIWLPLLVPPTLLAAGQYQLLLLAPGRWDLGGVLIAHLSQVTPYVLIVLAGPYRAFDPRLAAAAAVLGRPRRVALVRVKWPLLAGALARAAAIGFAVSVAQWVTTSHVGGGRVATLATEAVSLAAGGDRRLLATYALLQTLLPLAVFAAAMAAGRPPRPQR